MRALGVDRVEGGFVLALLDSPGRTPRVVHTWEASCPPSDDRAGALRRAIDEHCPVPPDAIATSLEESQVTHRLLHLPFTEPARLAATVPFELESLVPFDLDDVVTTFTVLSKGEGSDVLAALVPRAALAAHLDELARADIDPAVVDVGAMAVAGLIRLAAADALVVEPRTGGVVALLRDNALRGLHILGSIEPAGLAQEVHWLALALLGEEAPAAVVEVESVDHRTDTATFLGAPSLSLSEALPPWAAAVPRRHIRAVALAARAAGIVPTGVNFRTGDFVYHAPSEEARRQLRQIAVLAGIALLLGLGSYGVVVAERRAELGALRDEIRQIIRPIVAGAPRGQERIRLEGAVQGLERRLAMLGGSSSTRPPVLDVLRLIHAAIPGSTPFEIEELSIDGDSLRFRARTDSYESVDVIKRSLHELPGAIEPDIRDVKKGIDDRIEFRAAIEFQEGPRE